MTNPQPSHREVFFAHNGPGPYLCFGCSLWVPFGEVMVHHLDHDHSNDDPTNLAAAHGPCHMRHHQTGRTHSPEARARISLALARRERTPEHRARLSAAVIASNKRRAQ